MINKAIDLIPRIVPRSLLRNDRTDGSRTAESTSKTSPAGTYNKPLVLSFYGTTLSSKRNKNEAPRSHCGIQDQVHEQSLLKLFDERLARAGEPVTFNGLRFIEKKGRNLSRVYFLVRIVISIVSMVTEDVDVEFVRPSEKILFLNNSTHAVLACVFLMIVIFGRIR
ncbi:hypothetical protein WA026_019775 [Henosepilachna vigintioctopunctata]|uniref:Uncharacterized protein n=1 Tax=Henosepilachna vigintioctopunctata TaxID=420089 RepID=A0AAW1VIR0_9CUCU